MTFSEVLFQSLADVTEKMTPAFQAYTLYEIALNDNQETLPSLEDVEKLAKFYEKRFEDNCCGFNQLNTIEQLAYKKAFDIYVPLTELSLLLKKRNKIDLTADISRLLSIVFRRLDGLEDLADPRSAIAEIIADKIHLKALIKFKESIDDISTITNELTETLNDLAVSVSSRSGRVDQLRRLKSQCKNNPSGELPYYTVRNGKVIPVPFPELNS